MLEGDEIIQQDANYEDSSEPQDETSPENISAPEVESAQPEPKQVPFHEDPRVQDYIQRQIARQSETYEQKLQEMQRSLQERQQQAQPKQANPFVEKLREIDPAYADYIEGLETRANKVQDVEARIAAYEQQQIVEKYENTVNSLHSELKVSDELKPFIKEHLDSMALSGKLKDLSQVKDAYREVHNRYQSFLDAQRRNERASYVQSKSKDASVPSSQPKGKAPARDQSGRFTGNADQDLSSVVKRALKISRAENDI